MLLLSVIGAFFLPLFCTPSAQEEFSEGGVQTKAVLQVRDVSAISYALPDHYRFQEQILTREELLRGKMLLLDEAHPLPENAPPPNTVSVAKVGSGMVPVRSLTVKSGEDTIDALIDLFTQMKDKRMDGIYVWQGTVTRQQQRRALIEKIRELMRSCAPETAVRQAKEQHDIPGCTELLQEYTIELRQLDANTHLPLEAALEASREGQMLLQLAWRYGFVRSNPAHPYRFRYVGKAHAMAMTYLDLELEEYLEWMHMKKNMVISAGGKPQYLILCQPMNGDRVAVELPAGCDYEASIDNTGYVLVACTL